MEVNTYEKDNRFIIMLMDEWDKEIEEYLARKGIEIIQRDESQLDMVLASTRLTKDEITTIGCVSGVYQTK